MNQLLACLQAALLFFPAMLFAETLRIASDATFAPFHYLDEAGRATGFDIELARAIAEDAGFEVDVVVVDYDELFTGLEDGSHDLVAATTGITPARERAYLLSEPYFETCQAALVRRGFGEPLHVRELSERRVGASGSGTSYEAMLEILSAEQIRLGDGEGRDALVERRIDAWIVDEFDAVAIARGSHETLAVLPEAVATERYGFVMRRDDLDRMRRINSSLKALREDGRLGRLQHRFGVRRDAEWPIRF